MQIHHGAIIVYCERDASIFEFRNFILANKRLSMFSKSGKSKYPDVVFLVRICEE